MLKAVFSLIITTVLLSFESNAFCQEYQDVVYLKDGGVIHGIIIEQIPNESIKIKTKDGNIFVYKMEEIEKMTKEEIKREREHGETPTSTTYENRPGSNYSGFGIRGGVGTDITFGIGFGIGAFYVLAPSPYSSIKWDLGADIYYANVSETETDYEGNRFEDNTKLFVFALRSNGLFNYHPRKMGVYFVAGAGIVVANVNWTETIKYDYIRYGGVIEHWSNEGVAFGNVLNLGAGLTFGRGLEARLETPLLLFYDTPGKSNSIAPTFTLSILYRFP